MEGHFGIERLECFLPPTQSAECIARSLGYRQEVLERMLSGGIRRIPVAAPGTLAQLAAMPIPRLLDDFDTARVGGLVLAHSVPIVAPNEHSVLGELLSGCDLASVPGIILSGQPCSILHMGLRLAGGWLSQLEPRQVVMLIGADRAYHPTERFFFGSAMGDAAVGMILSRTAVRHRVLTICQHSEITATHGELSPAEDIALFRERSPLLLRNLLLKTTDVASRRITDVDWILPHTPYTMMWDALAKLLKYPRERILTDYIGETGHLSSNDSFAHYARAIRDNRVKEGDLVLLVNPGFGGTRGCTLLRS